MFYEVLVASQRYHKPQALVYEYAEDLNSGTVVEIPLQNRAALGIIINQLDKPKFKTKLISRVVASDAISQPSIRLIDWLQAYYPSPSGLINSLLAPSYLQGKASKDKPLRTKVKAIKLPKLTTDQAKAIKLINGMSGHSALLHGHTGSGKTRVYIELAKQNLAAGKSVIALTPEIGLTPQLEQSFLATFSDQVFVLHSGLTPKQRRLIWLAIAESTIPVVVIGPRSALFSPVKNIGLIVVDEMHDNAYKQEQAPYYLTSRVAGKLAELHGAKLILGSATPPVTDYYVFDQHKLPILQMKTAAIKTDHKLTTEVIDLKDRALFSQSNWLSDELIKSIKTTINRQEQALLFLNRRGTARVILCSACGWQALCPRCDLPMTYHGDKHQVICHTCGHIDPVPTSCPACRSTDIIFKSAGTKTVVTELERLFPNTNIKRFDSDLKKGDQLQTNFDSVLSGKVDILVGTQMLGKGLDLPKLSLVGVIVADTSLNFPDYTAQEKTYQMLNQVIGRVGRGHRAGTVVIQTYHPDSKLIKQALDKDYKGFYADQIKERTKFNFPPHCYLLKLSCSRANQARARQSAIDLLKDLSGLPGIEIIGPSPAFSEKAYGTYTWQLIIKSTKRSRLTDVIGRLPANWSYDIDPINLL